MSMFLDKEEACPKCGAETLAQGFHYDMQHCAKCSWGPFGADSLKESVTWTPAAELPDSDTTVQLFDQAASEPVWLGYYDGARWLYIDGMPATPTHYAPMLKGPTA
jgi:ribosomal protein S27AE